MSEMRTNLEEIYAALTSLNRPVVELFNEGISPERIEELLAVVGFGNNEEVVSLYQWRNGTRVMPGVILDDVHFFPGFYLLSIDDAIESYRMLRKADDWDSSWFPFMGNGGGDFYAAILKSGETGSAMVVGYIRGESAHPVEYVSIAAMMASIKDGYLLGAFYVRDGYLEMDDGAYAEIARRHNPGVGVWM